MTVHPLTYCNPLPVEDIPSGRFLDIALTRNDPRSIPDYRSLSDPSVIYHEGKWILYPSYRLAYVSEDFVHWKRVDIGLEEISYSPAIVQFRGKWYLCGHFTPDLYCADSPLGPFTLCGRLTDCAGKPFRAVDGCFLADGDRLFLYWHSSLPNRGEDVEMVTGTLGAELDPDRPWQLISQPVEINRFDPAVKWQRMGEHNQNARMGWIEGQWAFKIGSRYYLLYSGSGTEYSTYANGVLISDDGPLTGWHPQRRPGPLTEKRTGLVRGAGHGCVVQGPGNTWWTFYTNIFCFNHLYERRISMDPLGIDENGELYCPAVTETPQLAPGVNPHPQSGNDAGWLPLTVLQRPSATSHAPGREPIYAADESVLTWWQPAADDAAPAITFTLGSSTAYTVHALRIIWRDIGMETLDGILPGPFRYVVEYAADDRWLTLVDAAENTLDLCIDYRQVEPVCTHALRLRILGAPRGITPGLVSLTAFGLCPTRSSPT